MGLTLQKVNRELPLMIKNHLSIQLEARRKALGLSQQRLAKESTLSRSIIQRALHGGHIQTDTLRLICKALDLDVSLVEKGS